MHTGESNLMSEQRQEALLNEYKGNLYEYLVGLYLSRSHGLELDFIYSLTNDFKNMLSQQEQFIRQYYPMLLVDLPQLAISLVEKINATLSDIKVTKIQIVGKLAMASNDNRFSEADLLVFQDQLLTLISLKICKAHSFVNTKSAGLKSLFQKYFNNEKEQSAFNLKVESILDQLGFELYELAGLEYDSNYTNWIAAGLPSLPGQLVENYRAVYLKYIYSISTELYNVMNKIFTCEKENFTKSLLPLIGFSSDHIVQATTFYTNVMDRYQLYEHTVEAGNIIATNINDVEIIPLNIDSTSMEIRIFDRILQLRIKAMNKFTTKSYKINCSVKKIDSK